MRTESRANGKHTSDKTEYAKMEGKRYIFVSETTDGKHREVKREKE